MPSVQTTYATYPERGYAGLPARPTEPHTLDAGLLHVPTGATRNPRPGDAVYYDAGENAFAIPTSAAESLLVCGILSYRQDTVANDDDIVEFKNDDEVQVGVFGTFWVVAGSAMEYGQAIGWNRTDFEWDPLSTTAATTVAELNARLRYVNITCVSRQAVAADGLAMARIGYGRIL